MPPQAGRPPVKVPQVVIDLTLSDDEEPSSTQQQLSRNLKHAANLLQDVPHLHHGLPMFEPSAHHESDRRDGASGTNYLENPLQHGFKPLGATASDLAQPRSESRSSRTSNNRKSPTQPFASLKDVSKRRALGNIHQDRESAAKRRKTNNDSRPLGRRGNGATSVSPGDQLSPSTVSQPTTQVIDLETARGRTIITGESRLQSSYNLLLSSGDEECVPTNDGNNDSDVLLQKVLELIRLALRPYKDLASKDRNSLARKTARWLIKPELKANFESNNGQLSKQYEKNVAKEAKAFVETYMKTLRETRAVQSLNIPSDDDDFKEREGSSSSSPSAEEIFEQQPILQHPDLGAAWSRSYSESPTTEVSNDPIDGVGAQDLKTSRKARVSHSATAITHSLRRSGRAAAQGSRPSYVLARKRRRRNTQPDHASQTPAGEEVRAMAMDLDYEAENEVEERTPKPKMQHVPEHTDQVARPTQQITNMSEMIPADKWVLKLLKERENHGMAPLRVTCGQKSFKAATYAMLEDLFIQQSEWTDCSGDIASISWINDEVFLCGALAHLDPHNMQYNKPGNLLLGSTAQDTLMSFADHRVARPLVDKARNAENALDSMRRTQDPWIYPSVVSTAHCKKSGFSFTASFDETVKIWSIANDGSSMSLVGTWKHEGKVNFVVTSDHHERVATASEVNSNAVRIYNFDEDSVSGSAYDLYCGNKAREQIEEIRRQDTWSYQPATIQWGKAPQVGNLILVGYSPRSNTGDDVDIPDDKKNTGELCVWNAESGAPMTISSARTQNIFEVQWHPTQPIFVAATSPCGTFDTEKTKTQIRLFALNESDIFLNIRALDCPALDINELTIMANSRIQCYVTASCTDGNTYVYDTAQGDQAIHILPHGAPLETLPHDLPREVSDTGVTFAAWGQTTNLFYTGSSDGKVKAWDIKAPTGKAFVRNVLALSGGIATGAFSEDFSKLVIGDATGKVYLMSVNETDLEGGPVATKHGKSTLGMITSTKSISGKHTPGMSTAAVRTLQQITRRNALLPQNIQRPKLIIPHAEPSPPVGFEVIPEKKKTSAEISQELLDEGFLEQHVGAGVYQGPNYAETGLYCFEAHEEGDPSLPLLPEFIKQQQSLMRRERTDLKFDRLPRVKSSDPKKHEENQKRAFNFAQLSPETQKSLIEERAMIDADEEEWYQSFKYDFLPKREVLSALKRMQRLKNSEGRRRSVDQRVQRMR